MLRCDAPAVLQVYDSLEQAIEDTNVSIGFTRRAGSCRVCHASMTSLLQSIDQAGMPLLSKNSAKNDASTGTVDNGSSSTTATAAATTITTALVFGREESGLLDAEVSLCGVACSIPSAAVFPSLNLSHAVAVIVSQLYERQLELVSSLGGEDIVDISERNTMQQPPSGVSLLGKN